MKVYSIYDRITKQMLCFDVQSTVDILDVLCQQVFLTFLFVFDFLCLCTVPLMSVVFCWDVCVCVCVQALINTLHFSFLQLGMEC